jgi:hypothetical protein
MYYRTSRLTFSSAFCCSNVHRCTVGQNCCFHSKYRNNSSFARITDQSGAYSTFCVSTVTPEAFCTSTHTVLNEQLSALMPFCGWLSEVVCDAREEEEDDDEESVDEMLFTLALTCTSRGAEDDTELAESSENEADVNGDEGEYDGEEGASNRAGAFSSEEEDALLLRLPVPDEPRRLGTVVSLISRPSMVMV